MIKNTKNVSISPVLYGLILTGGKSSRMGTDKALIEYHGRSQREILFDMLEGICEKTFISMREEQQEGLAPGVGVIFDQNEFRGPFNGILSAHGMYPEAAWLVLACDLPLIDVKTLKMLLSARDPSKDATALATRASELPEPLAAIWEPRALLKSMQYLKTAESSCPRKFLLNSEIKLVYPDHDSVLANANSREEYERIRETLDTE